MNDFVYNLPPPSVQVIKKCDKKDLQGYLELEVSLINCLTTKNTDILLDLTSGKLPENKILREKQTKQHSYDTSFLNAIINNNYKNSASDYEKNKKDLKETNEQSSAEICKRINLLNSIHVKIVWCGERTEDAAKISISCKTQEPKQQTEHFELKTKRKYNKLFKKHHQNHEHKYKHQQQTKRQYLPLSANKLRYRICTNRALFLEYLRSCKPIRIIVTGDSGSCLTRTRSLGQAQLTLPLVLINRFKHNIIKGHNFNYKTKVYALYNKVEEAIKKSGEIQLRFKMLFAPTAAASASAVASTKHTNVIMHDKQHIHGNHYHQHHHNHHHRLGGKTSKLSEDIQVSEQNNNPKLETTNFENETSKIRLLKGFISANETRNFEIPLQPQAFLICRRFWMNQPATSKRGDGSGNFNYQEQFSIINDEKFLQRVDKQFLHLELWQRMSSDDGNGNTMAKPLGVVRMPLHQFFIAYRDATITNHLCKGKLPVISIDAWSPVINCQTGLNVGEIKCLLAVGSDEQIKNLKATRGFEVSSTCCSNSAEDVDFVNNLQPLQIPTSSKAHTSNKQTTPPKLQKTSELLDMLQRALMTSSTSSTANDCPPTGRVAATPSLSSSSEPKYSTEASTLPLKPSNIKLFAFSLEIQKAFGLPLNPAAKAKKGYSKRNTSKRFPPNEPPNCYVTFQADEGQYPTYKSHEGLVFATKIVEKSTQPQWQQRFRLAATRDYLKVPQKLFILKVLKKSSLDMSQGRNTPTPMEDGIIGLTALDLSAFERGLHIAGAFNIVDFNGRVNGQLMLRCQPLEETMSPALCSKQPPPAATTTCTASLTVDSVIDQFEQTLDLTHLNLGQAIKRKYTELEGISQRLRARLGDVAGSELPKDFDLQSLDAWTPVENEANYEFDEFEHDINVPPITEEEANDNNQYQGKSETESSEKSE